MNTKREEFLKVVDLALFCLIQRAEEQDQVDDDKFSIIESLAEITIDGRTYQVQLSLEADQEMWVKEEESQLREYVGNPHFVKGEKLNNQL